MTRGITPEIGGPLFDERSHARKDDPETSKVSAKETLKSASRTCQRVFNHLLQNGPATDEELDHYFRDEFSAHQRRADLTRALLVVDSGERRETKWGRPSVVWRVRL